MRKLSRYFFVGMFLFSAPFFMATVGFVLYIYYQYGLEYLSLENFLKFHEDAFIYNLKFFGIIILISALNTAVSEKIDAMDAYTIQNATYSLILSVVGAILVCVLANTLYEQRDIYHLVLLGFVAITNIFVILEIVKSGLRGKDN